MVNGVVGWGRAVVGNVWGGGGRVGKIGRWVMGNGENGGEGGNGEGGLWGNQL